MRLPIPVPAKPEALAGLLRQLPPPTSLRVPHGPSRVIGIHPTTLLKLLVVVEAERILLVHPEELAVAVAVPIRKLLIYHSRPAQRAPTQLVVVAHVRQQTAQQAGILISVSLQVIAQTFQVQLWRSELKVVQATPAKPEVREARLQAE